jgi:hypothetical protein
VAITNHTKQVLLQKLVVAQLVKNFLASYGTRKFIAVLSNNSSPMEPVLNQVNSVHALTLYILKLNFASFCTRVKLSLSFEEKNIDQG